MRLIIGGIYQGRERFARTKYGQNITVYRGLYEDVKQALEEIYGDNIKRNDENHTESFIEILGLHNIAKYDCVIAEEPYSGLTPISKEERKLTEYYGRVLEELANQAESVERVVCGLGQSLK